MKYSPSTGGFYDPLVHGDDAPIDAVEITAEQHRQLLAGQAQGQVIQAGAGGVPVLAAPMAPVKTWAVHQQEAALALARSDLTVLRCVEVGVQVPQAWATYRASLRAIVSAQSGDATQALPLRPAYPEGT